MDKKEALSLKPGDLVCGGKHYDYKHYSVLEVKPQIVPWWPLYPWVSPDTRWYPRMIYRLFRWSLYDYVAIREFNELIYQTLAHYWPTRVDEIYIRSLAPDGKYEMETNSRHLKKVPHSFDEDCPTSTAWNTDPV